MCSGEHPTCFAAHRYLCILAAHVGDDPALAPTNEGSGPINLTQWLPRAQTDRQKVVDRIAIIGKNVKQDDPSQGGR